MRKTQKKWIDELLKTLEEAHAEIKGALEKKNTIIASEMLEDCQQGVIGLGTFIDSLEGENVTVITLLEEYCEVVYQIFERIQQGGDLDTDRIYGVLQNMLSEITTSVNNIKVRKEVVFLPYKVTMWDSMESVWKAAVEDENCDAYVIPIPYYDRNVDRSFGKIHYEGGLYPSDVPVVWYEDYNFEERRPDAIFIHNPYDGNNFVTSIAPFFYSLNIKQFTEQLVYIPYFLANEVAFKDSEMVDKMMPYCTTPGVLYADKVIVQSKNMQRIYIDALSSFLGESTRIMWEKKVLGLGSPKYDKVRSVKREEVVVPKEWKSLFWRKDGIRKKVVLYSTCLETLLTYRGMMIEKMKNVFRFFAEKQEEVLLLWRPHPLVKATIESMCPELGGTYDELVEKYKKEGLGIYDDTTDLSRAIAVSDAHYGDSGSLVLLYQKVGKPVMIQNVEISSFEGYKNGVQIEDENSYVFEEMQGMVNASKIIFEDEKYTLNSFLLIEGKCLDNETDSNIGKIIYETVLR